MMLQPRTLALGQGAALEGGLVPQVHQLERALGAGRHTRGGVAPTNKLQAKVALARLALLVEDHPAQGTGHQAQAAAYATLGTG